MAGVGESPRPAAVEAEAMATGQATPNGPPGDSVVRVTFPAEVAGSEPPMVVGPWSHGQVIVDGAAERVSIEPAGGSRLRLIGPDGRHAAMVARLADPARAAAGVERFEVVIDGWRIEVGLEPERRARLRERATSTAGRDARGGPLELRAIIPGRVVSVDVAAGDVIEAGGRLLVVEAMKMQNELRSPREGTVGRIAVGPGQTVERGDLLLVIE